MKPGATLNSLVRSISLASVTLAVGGLVLAAAQCGAAENWPHWRGPLDTGAAPDGRPPLTWSETNNIKWKVKIPGNGSATPIIWENLVFIQTAIPTGKKTEASAALALPEAKVFGQPAPRDNSPDRPGPGPRGPGGPGGRRGPGGGRGMMAEKPTETYQFVLMCLSRKTGEVLWQKVAREELPHEGVRDNDGTYASTSPVTDGKCIYAYFGSRGLHCYDFKGNLKWEKDFGKMVIKMAFGEGSSPAIHGNAIVIVWDNEKNSFITALDTETSKELWRQSRDEGTSWSTPLIVEHDGKAQVITDATGKIRSYDLADGKVIWECSGLTPNVIPSPLAEKGMVYCMSGFMGNALLAIHLGRTGDLTGTDAIAWSYNKKMPYVPSSLLYHGKLYCLANNNNVLSCFDAVSGKVLIDAERVEPLQNIYASPVGAAGRVYLTSRNGITAVLKDSDHLEVLATNKLDDKFDASAAIVGNELFLRGRDHLYCIAEK